MDLKALIQSTRPAFLVLTPVCVFVGLSTALASQAAIDPRLFALALIGALCAHVSVNTLNEYLDFTNGLDLKTARTPFSGGSGTLPAHPQLARSVLVLGLASLAVTLSIGVYLISKHGVPLLALGLSGIVLIVTYTRWINRSPLLCLIAPGFGFGLLMVVGTHVVLTGSYAPLAWLVALVPFFLVNNLLLLNQYPDRDADASVGRRHFLIAFGVQKSNLAYAAFLVAAYATIGLLVVGQYLPRLALVALIPAVFSLFSLSGALQHKSRIGEHPRYLASNVAATLLTPLLLGVSILTG
jgi:1,4-dihydroxy-2-naphthoate octaprenyltransferase